MKYNLSSLCEYRKGKVNVDGLNKDTYISTENMLPNKGGVIRATSLPTTSQTQEYKKGDVLVSNIRPYFKKIWQAEYDGGCSNDVLVFKANENTDKDFLYYVLADDAFFNYSMATSKGTKMPRGDKTSIMQYGVPHYDIVEQKKIACVLRLLDKKIEFNNKINNNLEQQIEAILLSFIENTNSNNVKLGDYLYIKGRIGWKGLKKDEYLEHSDFRIINGESLTKAGIDWSKAGYISKSRYDESPEIMLKKGDILLSKDGTIGKIGYIDSLSAPTTVASGIFVIRNIQPEIISTTFIYFLLKSRLFTDFITARTEGSVIPHLYQKDFMQFEFPLPSKDEMASFEKLTAPMFSFIISNLNENDRLTRLRDSLLPRLMSGELDVSNISL